jgi:hypothetical protein
MAGYILAILVVTYCRNNFPSGPCNPNFDILSIFAAVLVSLILLMKNVIQIWTEKEKKRIYSSCIHFLGLLMFISYCIYG